MKGLAHAAFPGPKWLLLSKLTSREQASEQPPESPSSVIWSWPETIEETWAEAQAGLRQEGAPQTSSVINLLEGCWQFFLFSHYPALFNNCT